MINFKIKKDSGKIQSINRTIRIRHEHYEKIMELSEKTGISFNKIVNQCISYALDNIDESE